MLNDLSLNDLIIGSKDEQNCFSVLILFFNLSKPFIALHKIDIDSLILKASYWFCALLYNDSHFSIIALTFFISLSFDESKIIDV